MPSPSQSLLPSAHVHSPSTHCEYSLQAWLQAPQCAFDVFKSTPSHESLPVCVPPPVFPEFPEFPVFPEFPEFPVLSVFPVFSEFPVFPVLPEFSVFPVFPEFPEFPLSPPLFSKPSSFEMVLSPSLHAQIAIVPTNKAAHKAMRLVANMISSYLFNEIDVFDV